MPSPASKHAKEKVDRVTPLLAKAKQIVAAAKLADAAAKANQDKADKALAAADQDRDTFEASPDNATPLAAKSLADKYEAVWNLAHVYPEVLYWAGHFAKVAGEVARAQVLFDKAIVELERVNQQKMVLNSPNGFEAPDFAWYSPDGGHVLTIKNMRNERFRLLAVPSYQVERTLDFSPGAVAWSHDSRRLAIDNATINIVDVATGRVVDGMALSSDTTTSIAFSPDDQRVAWAIAGRSIAIGELGLTIRRCSSPTPHRCIRRYCLRLTGRRSAR